MSVPLVAVAAEAALVERCVLLLRPTLRVGSVTSLVEGPQVIGSLDHTVGAEVTDVAV